MSLLFAWNGNAQIKSIEEVMVRVPLNGVSLKEAFLKIEKTSDFSFVYTNKDINNPPKIYLENKYQSVYDVLLEIATQTGSTVCTPSRCALMAGFHTRKAFTRNNGTIEYGRINLPDTIITVAEIFKEQGYTTALFGKWGLGEPGTEGILNNQGFDKFAGFLNQGWANRYYDLTLHDSGFQSTEELRKKVRAGEVNRGLHNIKPGNSSAGSEHIISVVDASTENIHIAIWGGSHDLTQALMDVKSTRTDAEIQSFISKIRIYAINDQDLFTSPADIFPDYESKTLTVTIHSLSNPRRNRAAEELCKILTDTETIYPGTELKLIFKSMAIQIS